MIHMMKCYEVIFFDVDNTLFDFSKSEQIAFTQTFYDYNIQNDLHMFEKTYQKVSDVLWEDLENGEITLKDLGPERFKRLFSEHDLKMDGTIFNEDYLSHLGKQYHLMEGAEEVIGALAHKRLGIITNGFAEVQHSRISHSNLAGYFEEIIVSEEVNASKPQPQIFEYAFEKMNLKDRSKVLMVGDSLTSDIQGGINYQIDTCWFNPNQEENPTNIQPTYEINHLEELLDIIK